MRAGTKISLFIGAIAILLGFYVLIGLYSSTDDAGANASANNTSDSLDLTKNKKFQKESPGYLHAIAALIQMSGYECPVLTMLLVKGQSPYGSKFEALCGPDDGSHDTYPYMHYAVYPSRFKVSLCEEYSYLPKDCN